MALALGVLLGSGGLLGCSPSSPRQARQKKEDGAPLRDVRVLLAANVDAVRVRVDGKVSVTGVGGRAVGIYSRQVDVTLESDPDGAFRVSGTTVDAGGLVLEPGSGDTFSLSVVRNARRSPETRYAGTLRLTRDRNRQSLDALNAVDLERYVASVVAGEVWPTFAEEAYRAQAIAARTFVLYQMERRKDAPYDVEAGPGSQVYAGIRTDKVGRRAAQAAEYTRGLVCTWHDGERDRLFSTYYSAACGGISQSAAIFGKADDVPPLAGGVKCDYCRIAPAGTYRWGPVRLTRREVMERLVSRYSELAALGRLTEITVVERASGGRPVRLRITGSTGRTHEMLAEHFRLALGGEVIRSTYCDISLSGNKVMFEHGRGFGHGLGLCQWGMQGQARQGRKAAEILRYYYPGSKLTRVY